MIMDNIKNEFYDRGIQHSPTSFIRYFNEEKAIEIILRCKELGYAITGIESYLISGKYIQPFMEHSIDYLYSEYGSKGIGCWDEAIEFIKSKRQYGFDIFYNEMEIKEMMSNNEIITNH